MECYMGLRNSITPKKCAEYIYNFFWDELKMEANSEENQGRITVWCDYMSLTFYEELEKEDYDFYQEEYGICITAEIWLQVMGRTLEKGIEIFFILLNNIIHNKNLCEDFIFQDLDGWVILGRKDNYLYTQMRKGIDREFPFHLIEGDVIRDGSNPLSN